MASTIVDMPTAKDLADAHKRYEEEVCTHFVYDLAIEEIRAGRSAEGIVLLLVVWNRLNTTEFDPKHLRDALRENACIIADFEHRSISQMKDADQSAVVDLFQALDGVPYIGPIGAAKSIHLLAPDFLPLWDSDIAKAYGRQLGLDSVTERSPEGYWAFMRMTKKQYENVEPEWCLDVGILKALDEYNYCKYTLDVL